MDTHPEAGDRPPETPAKRPAARVRRKTIARSEWGRVLRRRTAYMTMKAGGLYLTAGLLVMDEVREPLVKTVAGQTLVLADAGYAWLQIAPHSEHWWLTVMFDRWRRVVQYYFDMTRKNVARGADSFFLDLFLDVVLLPDGQAVLLDEDELEQALQSGVVGRDEFDRATDTAARLLKSAPKNVRRLEEFCRRLLGELEARLE